MVNSDWMLAVTGLHYFKEGLKCFCDDVVQKQHTDLMEKCHLRSCYECDLDSLKPSHNFITAVTEKTEKNIQKCPLGQRYCNCLKPDQTRQCPNETCGVMYDEIIRTHGSTPPAPNWTNTDIKQWYSNPWAIAACFIKASGYHGRKSVEEFDCYGLLSVIKNNKAFLDHLDCSIDGKGPFSKAIIIRNKLFHSPSLEIEENKAKKYISVMIDALRDGKELLQRKESGLAVKKLKCLMERGFDLTMQSETVNKAIKGTKDEQIEFLIERIEKLEQRILTDNIAKIRKLGESDEKFLEAMMKVLQLLETHLLKNKGKDSDLKNAVEEQIKSNNFTLARVLLMVWYENINLRMQLEDKRIKDAHHIDQAAQTQYEMPTKPRPHDGRLITLTKEDVRGILSNCDPPIRGGFGEAHVSSTKVHGLDLRVVIKRIVVGKGDEQKMLSASNEKIASSVMHFAIVPLIGYMNERLDENRVFYFLSPYLEGGNLKTVIESDKLCSDSNDIQLKQQRRIEILFQVASALEYLHTPVPNYRDIVLHMDLTSANIVLDSFMNARVIDFGLAREMNEGQTKLTESKFLGTPGYYPTSRYSKLTVHEDYYNFGVVIRELLTGIAPYIEDGSTDKFQLRKCSDYFITEKRQKNIWKDFEGCFEDLVLLSTKCLNSKKEKLSAAQIVKTLEEKHDRNTALTSEDEVKCYICMVNLAVTGVHSPRHGCRSKVCVSCMRNSHVNPVKCPVCNEDVTPEIGHTTAALLIAGNHIKDEKDEKDVNGETAVKIAKSFIKEIMEIKDVLVSKYPCVIGCREENVKIVSPSNPGKSDTLLPIFEREISYLKSRKGLETLLLYYTGHHYPNSGFQLGGPKEILTLKYLQEALTQISEAWGSQTRIIVFLDCCHPPSLAESNPEISTDTLLVLQLNACRSCETSGQPQSGSIFQKFFIQALTRRSFNKRCHNATNGESECQDCTMTGDFISIEKLLDYISEHMFHRLNRQQPAMDVREITWRDAAIGYNVDFVVNYEFRFGEREKHVELAYRIFYDIIDLKKNILESVLADKDEQSKEKLTPVEFSDAIALRIHNGSLGGQEIHSMLKVSRAMDTKREIAASYRTASNILNGRVVLFVSTERFMKELDKKLLQQGDNRIMLIRSLSEFKNVLEKVADIRDLETIHTHLLTVSEKWNSLQENGENKELKIIFPCIDDRNFQDIMVLDLSTKL